jgi:hypothetical protein
VKQRPHETLEIQVLENSELPTIRAIAFKTRQGAFLFALSRSQMLKLAQMIVHELREMPDPD